MTVRIALDWVDGVKVSTVQLEGVTPPVYETMVFGGKYDQHMRRYGTEGEALAGHSEMTSLIQGHVSEDEL